jgi:Flp pilus assembly protein TadG
MAPIRHSGRTTDERGAALVEFALCLPLLLVVIAGIVDFGFAFQRYEVITNAAREGARLASLPQYQGNETMIKDRVRQYVQQGLSLSSGSLNAVLPLGQITVDDTVPLTVSDGTSTFTLPATTVTVVYNHDFLLLQPILGLINKNWGSSVQLRAQSQMRNEQPFGGPSGS